MATSHRPPNIKYEAPKKNFDASKYVNYITIFNYNRCTLQVTLQIALFPSFASKTRASAMFYDETLPLPSFHTDILAVCDLQATPPRSIIAPTKSPEGRLNNIRLALL